MHKNDIKGDFISKVSFEITKPERSGKIHKKALPHSLSFSLTRTRENSKGKQNNTTYFI